MRAALKTLGPERHRRERFQQGASMLEMTLIAPWFLFLFIGVVDLGLYSYSMIAVENAARVAAEYTSTNPAVAADQDVACTTVRWELEKLPSVSSLDNCNSVPLIVTAASTTGPDGHLATSISVTYQSARLIPIPGLLTGQLNVTRNVQMRVNP